MAAIRSRAESFTLDLPNTPMDVVPSAVLSPITELSMNLEHNSISMAKTPKRKLSLCNIGTPNTPNPSPLFHRTLSNESGYCPSSPVGPGFDSPTLEVLKSSNNSSERRKSFHLSKPLFKRWNSSPAGTGDDDYTNKENIPSPLGLPDDMKKDEFVFARPRVPSFVRRFSVPARSSGGRPLPQRSLSDPLSEQSTDWQPSALSPSKLSDSQDSACDVDFDDEHGDDDFMDEMVRAHHDQDDNAGMPSGMAGLLSAPLVSKKSPEQTNSSNVKTDQSETPKQPNSDVRPKRDLFNSTEKMERCRSNTHTNNDEEKHFIRPRSKSFALKRPNPPRDHHPMEKKRLRQRCMSLVENNTLMPSPLLSSRVSFKHRSPLKRSNSEVFENRPDFSFLGQGTKKLVGDFSRPYTLPFIEKGGQHQDLISITPETVVRVINGEFNDQIEAHIIDCRYPFEYKGGHIKGAINIYRKEDFYEEYLKKPKHAENKQLLLIFHCEFSSKRGPDMSRFLRNRDRDIHGKDYPSLHYPELYLLEGGYKNFFLSQKEFCEPQEYVLMVDEKHSEDLKLFSKRSKSWSEGHGKKSFRPGLNYR